MHSLDVAPYVEAASARGMTKRICVVSARVQLLFDQGINSAPGISPQQRVKEAGPHSLFTLK